MINRIVAFVLLLTLISTNLSRFFIYAQFKINQDQIATTLCENKGKPQLQCRGNCVLMKKLKAAEEKEHKQEQEALKKATSDVFLVHEPLTFSCIATNPIKVTVASSQFKLPTFNQDISHPPTITTPTFI
ncbi:hypothetical protein [Pedobacter glucosidilyticus]|uniref:hypothetical protein n=1 Tax=Pedobacter glucosidilyticus TaxID=1122941 RepID=UPI0026EAF820|nr:hypothetical protein [Pedobacter glucosidilyticus]